MQQTQEEMLEQAVALHQAGNLPQAEALYRQILVTTPDHPDGLHLLGMLLHQTGQSAAGLALIDRAIQALPTEGVYHDTRGEVLKTLGRLPDAIAAHRMAAQLRPQAFEPLYNLGNVLLADRRFEAAVESYREAAQYGPSVMGVYNNLGNACHFLGWKEEAAAAFRTALRLQPETPELMLNLAGALVDQDETREEAYAILDDLIHKMSEAIRVQPADERAHDVLGMAWVRRGDWNAAMTVFERAARLMPNSVLLWHKLQAALSQFNRFTEAEAVIRDALQRMPGAVTLWDDLATVLSDCGHMEEAAACCATALRLDPAFAQARWSLALIDLGRGRFSEGWEAYETRWSVLNWRRPFDGPAWDGTPAPQEVLTVYEEQGAGDFIQFCRLVPQLAEKMTVKLRVPRALHRLVGTLAGSQTLIEVDGAAQSPGIRTDTLPGSLHCPIMSLPRAVGLMIPATLPATPYLHADPALVAAWRRRVATLPGLRVGLAWAGNSRLLKDSHRSIPSDVLMNALEGIPGVSFVSLQKAGAPWTVLSAEQRIALGLVDWVDELGDFADTAALAAALDLVICVDTAVAHVAGAIGQQVWLLNRFDTDWRWMRGRENTPWYPTMRIFHQSTPGDWTGVLANVSAALAEARIAAMPAAGE